MATHTFTIRITTPTDTEALPLCQEIATLIGTRTGYAVDVIDAEAAADPLNAAVLLNQRCDVQGESIQLAIGSIDHLGVVTRAHQRRLDEMGTVQRNHTEAQQRILERLEQIELARDNYDTRLRFAEGRIHDLIEVHGS